MAYSPISTTFCIVLLCSLVGAQSQDVLMNETYRWRPTSAAYLASLGYTEVVGTLNPLTVPTHTPSALFTSFIPKPTIKPETPSITSAVSETAGAGDKCTIFIGPSVQLYYFPNPTATPNTNCSTGEASQKSAFPSQFSNFVSPSVYIVAPAISAGNAHRQVGNVYSSVTFSLAPDKLSTIEGQDAATKAYNFADLPCPPSEVASKDHWFYNPSDNPSRPYEPRISIPAEVFNLDPAWTTCTATAQYQGFDPPISLSPADPPSVPGPPRRFRRGAARLFQPPAHTNMPGAIYMPLSALPTTTTTDGLDLASFGPPGRRRREAAGPLPLPADAIMPGADYTPPTALPTATTTDDLDSGSFRTPRRLRRIIEQADLGPQQPEETYTPTRTFVP